jgi:hypothetical protein
MQASGATYHITARATFGRVLFRENDDRRYFEFRLDDVARRFEWSCKRIACSALITTCS